MNIIGCGRDRLGGAEGEKARNPKLSGKKTTTGKTSGEFLGACKLISKNTEEESLPVNLSGTRDRGAWFNVPLFFVCAIGDPVGHCADICYSGRPQ